MHKELGCKQSIPQAAGRGGTCRAQGGTVMARVLLGKTPRGIFPSLKPSFFCAALKLGEAVVSLTGVSYKCFGQLTRKAQSM